MNNSSDKIRAIYKSRSTLLELLDAQGYDVEDYVEFSLNEVDAMFNNDQLDMLLTHKDNGKKTYIKYYTNGGQLHVRKMTEMIDELYNIENVLNKDDDFIIIYEDDPNDTVVTNLKYLYDNEGIFIVVHNIKRLQFNILEHSLVPESRKLNAIETDDLMKKYNLSKLSQLPEVSRFDPQSLAMCLRPGQVCEYKRQSNTAITTNYYRVCV
uniref:RNA polymerase subunit H/Rpb5 C-terminal domain-containing protein n=1 Tax=viral metagenome TaxID=1070528 RepID=A0A6C0C2W1_9ZZZZ